MALSNDQAWIFTLRAENELKAALATNEPTYRDIDHLIEQYRSRCQTLLFKDFEFAGKKAVEAHLWDAHSRINTHFRKKFTTFLERNGQGRAVEKRKLMRDYLDFIKSSQRFYRRFIFHLALHFGGIPELDAVARQLDASTLAGSTQISESEKMRHAVLISCHRTLICLGDLSRYRETELATKERNWGPAVGYYDLAGVVYPQSGASHNQLAVIASAGGSHLRTTYHLYRALVVEEPHEPAKSNLKLEFKKVLTAWDRGELVSTMWSKKESAEKALISSFMRLHATYYKGVGFLEYDELENEMLSQLSIDLKERSLEGIVNKIVLINVSAEYLAGVRIQAAPESIETIKRTFFSFQRLNVKTLVTLLLVLQPELERLANGDKAMETISRSNDRFERVTTVTRRILPALRHYSSWLISNSALLVAQTGDTLLNVQIKEMWKNYANTLTLIAATFPAASLPEVDYLLEEDEDTLGFKPFDEDRTKRRYFLNDDKVRKPKMHEKGVKRHHPNVEMLGRIRDFLTDGLELALDESIPVDLVENTINFAY